MTSPCYLGKSRRVMPGWVGLSLILCILGAESSLFCSSSLETGRIIFIQS